MSFIAGYILGCGRTKEIDPRIKKLMDKPTLWRFDIADGWNVRVKIASDVDNMQYFQFGNTHGGIVNYMTQWSIYYCVYLNDKFKFASCDTVFYPKHHENYQNLDVPDRLYYIREFSGFIITSGEMIFSVGGSEFLYLKVTGTCTVNETNYGWDAEENRIKYDTVTSTDNISHSISNFGGSTYKGSYIINGSAEDFKNTVNGLYAVCRSLA